MVRERGGERKKIAKERGARGRKKEAEGER